MAEESQVWGGSQLLVPTCLCRAWLGPSGLQGRVLGGSLLLFSVTAGCPEAQLGP